MFNRSIASLLLILSVSVAFSAAGQHAFQRTMTVDPSGRADKTTIQDAIISIGNDPTDKWTVFVYAGTYNEAVVLGNTQENIDIIGMDGEAVIIVAPADKDAITIKGVGARNNTVRNLTIIADDDTAGEGRGIVIAKDGTGNDPSAIRIIGVTITTNGNDSDGIFFYDTATDVEIRDTTITTTDGHGIQMSDASTAPSNITIDGVTIRANGTGMMGVNGAFADEVTILNSDINSKVGIGVEVGDDFLISGSRVTNESTSTNPRVPALLINDSDNVVVTNCSIEGGRISIYSFGVNTSSNIMVTDSSIRSMDRTVYLTPPGPNWVFQNCQIVAENLDSTGKPFDVGGDVYAIYLDLLDTEGSVVFQGCRIEAVGHKPEGEDTWPISVTCIQNDDVEDSRLIDCDLRAVAFIDKPISVFGVRNPDATVVVQGGAIETVHLKPDGTPYLKGVNVFDLSADATSPFGVDNIFVDNVDYTSWQGRINASGRPVNVTQTVNNIDIAKVDQILTATTLTVGENPVTPTAQPDVYRVLSVTGNHADLVQMDVYIIGTNWGGDRIVEKVTLNGTNTVNGKRPFRTVTTVLLPGSTQQNRTVEVGTSNTLGLYYPLESATDVLQQARAADTTSAYVFETLDPYNVDAVYSTVNINATLTDGDSMQWLLVTAR